VSEPYTHGIWQVKAGRADEFVTAWQEFADWSMRQAKGILWGVLLRDTVDRNRFVGAGAWESFEDIQFWRWDTEYERRFAALEALVDHVEFSVMELAAAREDRDPPDGEPG
jgi:quinol monooxygenase YgiN